MPSSSTDLDLNAAWLRKARGDFKPFMAALAARLGDALPGRVTVDRQREGLFSKTSYVVRITVRLEPDVFMLQADRGVLAGRRSKLVRGVTLRSDPLTVPDWLAAVTEAVASTAGDAEAGRAALHELLLS